jgi:hypothetical protein
MNQPLTFSCGLCQSQVPLGAHVCTGCQGTVIYGPTHREVTNYPMLPALIVFFGLMYLIGMSNWHGMLTLALAVITYVVFRQLVHRWRRGIIRTFRRM